jgi:UDP-glucose 4-epimerase
VPVHYGDRREGDPPRLVADSSRIRQDWGWIPRYSELEMIVAHAWRWENANAVPA